VDLLLRRIMRLANSRALSGDDLAWFGVAAAAWFFLRIRRRAGGSVISVPMHPGDRIMVSVRDQLAGEETSGRR